MNSASNVYEQQSRKVHIGAYLDRLARKQVQRRVRTLKHGRLEVTDPWGTWRAGRAGREGETRRMYIRHHSCYRRFMLGGSLGVAEAYMDGLWTSPDLPGLIEMFIQNMESADDLDRGISRPAMRVANWLHRARRNSRRGSRRNIGAHYDLSNEFFQLWLDETMTYSSAIFDQPNMTLQQGSVAKLDRICRKLALSPNDHVLEIGAGWGSFAMHAARHYGCQVTTTTISRRQYDLAKQRIHAAGLDGRINLLLEDYRDLTGEYDKLVSIEMIEAVGFQYLDQFFNRCMTRLKPNGQMVLQGIVMPEQRYTQYRRTTDFIQKHVFPGSCLPSLGAITESIKSQTDFRITHLEDIGPHYAETLRRWRADFLVQLDAIRNMGFSERFIRTWDYYLSYCEAGFESRYIGNLQLMLQRPQCRRSPLLGEVAGP